MEKKETLHKNIILTGFTSFFTDVSSEMIYPLLQAFVSMILAAQKAILGPVLGIIEGLAESTASLLKVFVGYYSDRIESRKTPTIAGYILSALAKIGLFLGVFGWIFVLFSRFFDRIGKGIRTSPRDALISESVDKKMAGRAFGFQRAMDFAGAALGVLICYFISLKLIDPVTKNLKSIQSFYRLFLISIIPAFIGVCFLFFIKDIKSARGKDGPRPKPRMDIRKYDRNLRLFILSQLIFTLGNSSNQFLLLRSASLGFSLSAVILMYLFFNLSSSLLSTFFGSLSDRAGKKRILLCGYLIYTAVYISFGFISRQFNRWLWVFWIIYGVYYAMTEGVEKAFVSNIAPTDSKATVLGFYNMVVGFGLLPASLIAGLLFSVHPSAPFIFGGVMSFSALLVLLFFVKEERLK